MPPEEHDTVLGFILRLITDTEEPAQEPKADRKLFEQMRDAALLQGPDPFPGLG